MAESTCKRCGDVVTNGFGNNGTWYHVDDSWHASRCYGGDDHVPLSVQSWHWRWRLERVRPTVISAAFWALIGWFTVPMHEINSLVGSGSNDAPEALDRALFTGAFVWLILHFRRKYLRAKSVAEAAEKFVLHSSCDVDNRSVYFHSLWELAQLHRMLDEWKERDPRPVSVVVQWASKNRLAPRLEVAESDKQERDTKK